MDMKYYIFIDSDCPEEYSKCSVEVMNETEDKLWCMACEYMHVFDEFEYDDDNNLVDAVEKINRYGIKGNYYNNKYYIPESYINEYDWILRYEDNHIYEITEFIHCSGTIIATKFVKAFEVPKEDGIHYVEELDAYVKVEYEEDYGWTIVP